MGLPAIYPENLVTTISLEPELTVVLSALSVGDTVVTLTSTDTAVMTVPASVTVLDGEQSATFIGSALLVGTTVIQATYDEEAVTSSVTVQNRQIQQVTEINVEVTQVDEIDSASEVAVY